MNAQCPTNLTVQLSRGTTLTGFVEVQVETERFNELYSVRSPDIPEADFLAVVVERAKAIYEHAFHELIRQVLPLSLQALSSNGHFEWHDIVCLYYLGIGQLPAGSQFRICEHIPFRSIFPFEAYTLSAGRHLGW